MQDTRTHTPTYTHTWNLVFWLKAEVPKDSWSMLLYLKVEVEIHLLNSVSEYFKYRKIECSKLISVISQNLIMCSCKLNI